MVERVLFCLSLKYDFKGNKGEELPVFIPAIPLTPFPYPVNPLAVMNLR